MMSPLTLLSLLNTGISLIDKVSGVAQSVAPTQQGQGAEFAELVNSLKTSLETTPQSATGLLLANGSASLATGSSGNKEGDITDATLEALNTILSGKAPVQHKGEQINDIDDAKAALAGLIEEKFGSLDELAEGDNTPKVAPGAIFAAPTQVNDPFGIKAAQANGSPMAAPVLLPADSSANIIVPLNGTTGAAGTTGIDGLEGAAVGSTIDTGSDGVVTETKPANTAPDINKLKVDANRLEKQSGDVEARAVDSFQKEVFGKDNSKVGVTRNDVSQLANAGERLAEKVPNSIQQPVQSVFSQHVEQPGINDIARAVKAKADAHEAASTAAAYKVVNVSRKDNILDVRLEPLQLGKVQMKIEFNDGKANIMIFADRPETLDILQKDSREIQKILAENGVKADSSSLSFNLRGENGGNGGNNNFFTGKAFSLSVEEEVSKHANSSPVSNAGYLYYSDHAATGGLNILV